MFALRLRSGLYDYVLWRLGNSFLPNNLDVPSDVFARAELHIRSDFQLEKYKNYLPARPRVTKADFPKRPRLRAQSTLFILLWRDVINVPRKIFDNRRRAESIAECGLWNERQGAKKSPVPPGRGYFHLSWTVPCEGNPDAERRGSLITDCPS